MSNRIRKSCIGCRAYEPAAGGKYGAFAYTCSLGYSQDKGKPQEPCPRPTTVKALVESPKRYEV